MRSELEQHTRLLHAALTQLEVTEPGGLLAWQEHRMVDLRALQMRCDSLERLVPDELEPGYTTGEETLQLHLERYEFASRYARQGRLLDIACGVGYGTRLLTDRSRAEISAIGVDISAEATCYARERYENDHTHFITCDAMQFQDPEGFDTIVSLETIEHVPDPAGFIDHMIELLRPGGIFVGSVPTTPSVDANPHHLHDFSERSFRRLSEHHDLVEVDALRQIQVFKLGAALTRSEPRMEQIRRNLLAYYLYHPGAFARRIWSTLRHGFTNHYITIIWQGRG